MTKKDDLTTGQSVMSHDVPVDMTVSRHNVDVNTSESNVDNTDPKASAIIPQDVANSQKIDNKLSVDIPHCNVNIEEGQKEHPDLLINKDNDSKNTVDSTSN